MSTWAPISSETLAEFRRMLAKVSAPERPRDQPKDDPVRSFYEEPELEHLTGLKLVTRQRLSTQGHFPTPRQTPSGPRWHRADLAAWLTNPPRFLQRQLEQHWAKSYGLGK